MKTRRLAAGLLVAAALAGCAATGGGVRPGATLDEVRAQWGEPKAMYQVETGQRLFYSPQPWQVQRLDFDAQGRLQQVHEQMLTPALLSGIVAGQWRAADVQQAFGPPARRMDDADKGSQWVYSYQEHGVFRLARIHFNTAGVVTSVVLGEDPAADSRYR